MRKIFFLLLVLLVCFYPLLHAQPANAVKRYDAGLKFYNDKKYQQALGELDEAISIYPSYTLAYYTRGNALYALKNYEEALDDYCYVVYAMPKDAGAFYNRGNAYYALKYYDSAYYDYEVALDLNPKMVSAYIQRGNVLSKFQEYERAVSDYTKALEINPNTMGGYYNRALSYMFLGQYQSAYDDLYKAVGMDEKRVYSNYVLAVIEPLAHMEKFDEVVEVMNFFRKEYESGFIDNQNKTYFKKYVEAITGYITKSDYAGALKLLQEAELDYSERPTTEETLSFDLLNYSSILTLKGYVYRKLNNELQAKQAYEQSLVINPNQPDVAKAVTDMQAKATIVMEQDQTDPTIKILEPVQNSRAIGIDDDVTPNTTQRIRGQAIDPSGIKSVRLNNKLLKIEENGYFDTVVIINAGVNVFTIVATDKAANTASETIQINTIKEKIMGAAPVSKPVSLNYDPVYHAILIAETEYDDRNIPSLQGPVKDMRKIFRVLNGQYNFEVGNTDTLVNANKTTILETIINKANALGENDNLVIFYAGHGELIKQPDNTEEGFLVPVDAKKGKLSSYISSDDLMRTIKYSKSRHILFVADACFAGSLFRDMQKDAPTPVVDAYKDKSRKLLASGNRTTVPDESEFIEYFRMALQENKEKYITAEQLIDTFKNQYRTATRLSLQYFPIKNVEDFGGQFVFKRK